MEREYHISVVGSPAGLVTAGSPPPSDGFPPFTWPRNGLYLKGG